MYIVVVYCKCIVLKHSTILGMESFLITRPERQGGQIKNFLQQSGYEAVCEPLCDVEFLQYEKDDIKQLKSGDVQAVFITSYNASDTFLSFDFDKDVNIFAIGDRSVKDIRVKGYKNIFLPDSPTVLELEKAFLQHNPAQTGEVFYFCGNYLTRDLSLTLARYKFDIKSVVSYLVKYHEELSENFLRIAKQRKFDNILCYSKNNARCLAKLAIKHNLFEYFDDSNIVAISQEVALELQKFNFSKVKTFNDYQFLRKYYNKL